MLDVENLSTSYGPIRALSNVSLSVGEGQIVGILGANGAGKSTLLNCIAGLIRPDSGHITFEGRRIDQINAHQRVRRGLSLVPEGRRVFPGMTSRQNLLLAAYASGRGKSADVEGICDLFPALRESMHRPAGTLSGGQQQMLAVGRALITMPRLLLLDEPSMGLSPILVGMLFEKLSNIRLSGTTLCIVEQSIHQVLRIADYIYVLRNGVVAAKGSPTTLSRDENLTDLYLGSRE